MVAILAQAPLKRGSLFSEPCIRCCLGCMLVGISYVQIGMRDSDQGQIGHGCWRNYHQGQAVL
jgi:tRNA(Arg) A34 adenosine deaminase TadA